jgi:hypothetical protein
MNLMTWTHRPRPDARRRRGAGLAVESIETRLAPSPTLPLPPAHVPSTVASFTPPDPCAQLSASFIPPDPCAQPARSFERPEVRLDFPPDPI